MISCLKFSNSRPHSHKDLQAYRVLKSHGLVKGNVPNSEYAVDCCVRFGPFYLTGILNYIVVSISKRVSFAREVCHLQPDSTYREAICVYCVFLVSESVFSLEQDPSPRVFQS